MATKTIEKMVTSSYVVEGATLKCAFGTSLGELNLPTGHGMFIKDKRQANVSDRQPLINITPFGACRNPIWPNPIPCVPIVSLDWLNGKPDIYIDEHQALLNTSIAVCNFGGIITIVDDGQLKATAEKDSNWFKEQWDVFKKWRAEERDKRYLEGAAEELQIIYGISPDDPRYKEMQAKIAEDNRKWSSNKLNAALLVVPIPIGAIGDIKIVGEGITEGKNIAETVAEGKNIAETVAEGKNLTKTVEIGANAEKPIAEGAGSVLPKTTEESVKTKLDTYLLEPTHPVGGSKANWFKQALGFDKTNSNALSEQIKFNPETAVPTSTTEFGTKFSQTIPIKGINGKIINVEFIWIRNNDGIVRLVTSIPTKL